MSKSKTFATILVSLVAQSFFKRKSGNFPTKTVPDYDNLKLHKINGTKKSEKYGDIKKLWSLN